MPSTLSAGAIVGNATMRIVCHSHKISWVRHFFFLSFYPDTTRYLTSLDRSLFISFFFLMQRFMTLLSRNGMERRGRREIQLFRYCYLISRRSRFVFPFLSLLGSFYIPCSPLVSYFFYIFILSFK